MNGIDTVKKIMAAEIDERYRQGYDVEALEEELRKGGDSYDLLFSIAYRVNNAPYRADWPYTEPNDWESIKKECDNKRVIGLLAPLPDDAELDRYIKCAFLASVCGCILGKPLEEAPYGTLDDIQTAAMKVGEWPITDYVSERMLEVWGRRNPSWTETTKGNVRFVAPDDDITYSIMGMMLIEKKGVDFTHDDIRQLWIENLPIYTCWGPERTILLKAGYASLTPDISYNMVDWVDCLNPGQELCGAMIRADAYGYACPGNPALAAELAFCDASFTHRKTGVYSAMFIAAAIATAFVANGWKEIILTALQYIPQKSRFYEQTMESLRLVEAADTFEKGYHAVHERFKEYGAGRIVQEIGTVINTLRFANSPQEGVALQVAQGNDTDSFACSCGSILGAFFRTEMPRNWIEPFCDNLHTTMGSFYDTSLSSVANRMTELHRIIKQQ